jgi:hypothetical protein
MQVTAQIGDLVDVDMFAGGGDPKKARRRRVEPLRGTVVSISRECLELFSVRNLRTGTATLHYSIKWPRIKRWYVLEEQGLPQELPTLAREAAAMKDE